MRSNTIDFITMGCSKNLVDTEHLMRQLKAAGYHVNHEPQTLRGDIVVINTCGFIGDAKEESINEILRHARRKQDGQIRQLYVMGCLSERYRKELNTELPEVDGLYGKFDYNRLVLDLGHELRPEYMMQRVLTTPSQYAYLKIAEGCDRTCSYCAIPLITGPHRSRPMDDIISEARWLAKRGVRELQLIAQDLSYYGQDLYHAQRLPELVERLADLKGIDWIRLHYAYPAHFPTGLLRVMRERPNVCRYLDIALQHASDHILRLMRRNISKQQTLDLLQQMREEVPGLHLRTTLMLGHPDETADDVEELLQFVDTQRFERLGAFAFCAEEGTYAARNYTDNIAQEEKLRRVDLVMRHQERIAAEQNQQKVGALMRVIVDRQEGDYYIGRTEFDSPEVDNEVLIPLSESVQVGQMYDARITAAETYDLYATTQA